MCRTLGLWPTGFSEPFPTHVLETMSGSPDIERGEEYKPLDQSDAIAEESEALLAEETVKGPGPTVTIPTLGLPGVAMLA